MNGIVDQLANTDNLDSVSNIPGMDNLEARNAQNILSSLFSQGG
jgi:hypothetical protein